MSADIQTSSMRFSEADISRYVRRLAWQHRYLLAIVATYNCITFATIRFFGDEALSSDFGSYSFIWLICIAGVYSLAWYGPVLLARFMPLDSRENGMPSQRVLQCLFVIVLTPLFFASVSVCKILIPSLHPYDMDGTFATWDRILHGGIDPWRLLHKFLGYPSITRAVDAVYAMWFFIIFGTFIWQSISIRQAEIRMRFLISFMLAWIIIGTIAATLFSSAGPVYVERLTGNSYGYAELLAYLHELNGRFPIIAANAQHILWESYGTGAFELGRGISAMPSMHVAAAILVAFLGWHSGRYARICMTLFLVAIFLGSIHLGWHYALDGYVAILLALLIWKGALPLTQSALAERPAPA